MVVYSPAEFADPYIIALAELLKPIFFVMSVFPSVRMEQLGSEWTYFHEIWYLGVFRESIEVIKV